MRVEAKNFHPMRGHVENGAVVVFSDGRKMTVRSSGMGWALFDGDEQVCSRVDSAMDLTAQIVQLEAA